VKFIPRLVKRQQMNAVGENLPTFKEPMGANDDRTILLPVVDGASSDQDFSVALAILQAEAV
jgi:hypothetical protein